MPVTAGTGIHWQVAQATSLQNIVFNMRSDGGTSNAQQVSEHLLISWKTFTFQLLQKMEALSDYFYRVFLWIMDLAVL
jgi:hypothetical protein